MPEIQLPTKAGQEEIKQIVTVISNNFPIDNGTNWSTYTNLVKEIRNINSSKVNEYKEAIVITGKGYIKGVTSVCNNNSHGLKITVDGIVVFESYTQVSQIVGLAQSDQVLVANNSVAVRQGVGAKNILSAREYPFIDSSTSFTSAVCLLSNEIFFNSSIKIETRSAQAAVYSDISLIGGIE